MDSHGYNYNYSLEYRFGPTVNGKRLILWRQVLSSAIRAHGHTLHEVTYADDYLVLGRANGIAHGRGVWPQSSRTAPTLVDLLTRPATSVPPPHTPISRDARRMLSL